MSLKSAGKAMQLLLNTMSGNPAIRAVAKTRDVVLCSGGIRKARWVWKDQAPMYACPKLS